MTYESVSKRVKKKKKKKRKEEKIIVYKREKEREREYVKRTVKRFLRYGTD